MYKTLYDCLSCTRVTYKVAVQGRIFANGHIGIGRGIGIATNTAAGKVLAGIDTGIGIGTSA